MRKVPKAGDETFLLCILQDESDTSTTLKRHQNILSSDEEMEDDDVNWVWMKVQQTLVVYIHMKKARLGFNSVLISTFL